VSQLSESEPTTVFRPPQGSVVWYDDLLKILETRKITKVDKGFLQDQKIASGNENKMIAGLKFLGLIDNEGNASEAMDNLSVVGGKRVENIEKVVRNAYSLLFDEVKIDLEKAEPDTLINCFKTDYGMGSITTAKQAAKIFVFFAQKAGITLSKSITENLAVTKKRKRPIGVSRRKKKERSESKGVEEMQEQLSEDVLARFTLKGTGYVDIKDKDTFGIAKAYLKVLSKKLGITEEEAN